MGEIGGRLSKAMTYRVPPERAGYQQTSESWPI
jgi:hypothetical protein